MVSKKWAVATKPSDIQIPKAPGKQMDEKIFRIRQAIENAVIVVVDNDNREIFLQDFLADLPEDSCKSLRGALVKYLECVVQNKTPFQSQESHRAALSEAATKAIECLPETVAYRPDGAELVNNVDAALEFMKQALIAAQANVTPPRR